MVQRLSWHAKLLYGSGDTGFSLTSTIVGAYFAIFLTDVVGLAPAVAAAAIFIGRTWDYFNDPFIGYLSDRTRTRWGRRRPFLLFGALPFGAVFAMLWWRPPFTGCLCGWLRWRTRCGERSRHGPNRAGDRVSGSKIWRTSRASWRRIRDCGSRFPPI